VKFNEKTCVIGTFALILRFYSLFPPTNGVGLRFLNTCS